MRTMLFERRSLAAACLVLLLANELPAADGRASERAARCHTNSVQANSVQANSVRANSVRTELAHNARPEITPSATAWGAGRRWGLCIAAMAATGIVVAIGSASAGPVGGTIAFGALLPLLLDVCS